jgi:hypothetical protein
MKIIKRPGDLKFNIACKICRTQFEFFKHEGEPAYRIRENPIRFFYLFDDCIGGSDLFFTAIRCPACGTEHAVSDRIGKEY